MSRPDEAPVALQVAGIGLAAAAIAGALVMYATVRAAEWLRSPFVLPVPTRATDPTPVPFSPRSIA